MYMENWIKPIKLGESYGNDLKETLKEQKERILATRKELWSKPI